ncbi:DUF2599 domain-containing protein [Sanguibacter sp. A246]|uniref:DUF2599 domain-containing protein n=1 Tax=Sanguibacter sp. A246 TaxID=3457326 RepID=UPI003FD890A8
MTLRSAATDAAPVRAGLTAGTVAVTASLAPDDILTVTVAGARWTAYPDGSATLADDDAALVGGTQPTATDDNGVRRTTTRTEDDGRTLIIAVAPPVFPVPEPSAATAPGRPAHTTVTFAIAPRALVGATWADDVEGGRSLQVDPTAFGRSGSTAALEAVRAELVAAHTEAATTVMDHQLRCHALGAPDKTTWNLEPWRPEGSYLDYLLARCNPS